MFGGVNPGQGAGVGVVGGAAEAVEAFAALRCSGCYNGGPFMGIPANGFLRRNGHCS